MYPEQLIRGSSQAFGFTPARHSINSVHFHSLLPLTRPVSPNVYTSEVLSSFILLPHSSWLLHTSSTFGLCECGCMVVRLATSPLIQGRALEADWGEVEDSLRFLTYLRPKPPVLLPSRRRLLLTCFHSCSVNPDSQFVYKMEMILLSFIQFSSVFLKKYLLTLGKITRWCEWSRRTNCTALRPLSTALWFVKDPGKVFPIEPKGQYLNMSRPFPLFLRYLTSTV